MTSGKWAVVLLIMLGLAGVLTSQLYYAGVQGPAIEAWGRPAMVQILQSSRIEAMRLTPADPTASQAPSEILTIDGRDWLIVEQKPAAGAPGIGYIGTTLTVDKSFGEDESTDSEPVWEFAMRYGGEHSPATIAFAPNARRAMLVETGSSAAIAPAMPAIERVMRELFAPREKSPSPAGRGPG